MRQALRLSQEAGNDALASEMLAGMSHHAAFHGRPEDAVDLALAAGQLAETSGVTALKAETAVMEAHGLALQGDRTECLNALRIAEKSFANSDHDDTPEWLGYFDEAYLAAKFAHTFRDLGQPREAEAFARRSLDMSDGYERGKLFNTALLASILADQKRVDEACATGLIAVKMADTVRSVRSAAYLADVARRLAPFSDVAGVKSLYGHLVAVGIPVPTA
jgi:tetratricopeptide (TPR) repeat protein